MKKFFTNNIVFILIVVFLLSLSTMYKNMLDKEQKKTVDVSEIQKDKEVISLWMKESDDTKTKVYQIDRYNKENKDNIFIDFHSINQNDYSNLLRTSLASDNKPDIFQYGYFDLLKNKDLLDIDKLELNPSLISNENYLYYDKVPIGLKIFGDNVKIVWNKDILQKCGLPSDKPPATWPELVDYSLKIKKQFPDIIPFEFPAYSWDELRASIGEVSANNEPIYTTFWNYQEGKYEFSYMKDILKIFNDMYSQSLIDKNFETKSSLDLRRDFYGKKTAMIISTYKDRNYFDNVVPLNFNVGIDNLPLIKNSDKRNYYFLDYTTLVVNKDVKNKDSIKKVLEWFLSDEVNKETVNTKKALPINGKSEINALNIYDNYANKKYFRNEKLDPTSFISYDAKTTTKLVNDAIAGRKNIDDVIKELNKNYVTYCKTMIEKESFKFENYINNSK